jgi:tetratricopeptide (TPR) repeat protein
MRVLVTLALLVLAPPALAQAWPDKAERKPLSARAKQIAAPGYYGTVEDLDYSSKEVAACSNPPDRPDYCADVVLTLASPTDEAQLPLIGRAIDATLARYPVDLFPLLTLRRPPTGNRMAGLVALGLAADRSGTEAALRCRNMRATLALTVARWHMGGSYWSSDEPATIARHCGTDSAEAVAAANIRAVMGGLSPYPDTQTLDAAKLAHDAALRAFGATDRRTAVTAANRGILLARTGAWSEAEPLLRTAYTTLDALPDRAMALAALVPLAELLLELNRVDQARVLFAGRTASDPAIGGPLLEVRALSVKASLTDDNSAALALFDQAVALARRIVAQPPDPTLVEFERHQIARLGDAGNQAMFQSSIDSQREELERFTKSQLADVLTARAGRAFNAAQPAVARDSAREARTLDPSIRRAYLFEGLAGLALGQAAESEFLFGSAAIGLPESHPERMLVMMGMTLYQLGWAATYAPCYARKGTQAALARLAIERGDSNDNGAAFRSFAPVFRLQVIANWTSAQGQERVPSTSPRTCPGVVN